jgi:hypothetical protein
MTVPTTALFIAADEPLLVFSSIGEAAQYLESADVYDGVYPAVFGPLGEPYAITADDGCVIIEPTGGPDKPDDLKRLLLRYLKAIGRTADEATSVDVLVAQVWTTKAG